ncbi:MAG: hypothetical protein ACK2T5_10690, partial [Anaerolineales bacterium]
LMKRKESTVFGIDEFSLLDDDSKSFRIYAVREEVPKIRGEGRTPFPPYFRASPIQPYTY